MIPAMEVAAVVSISREIANTVMAARNRPKSKVKRRRVEVDIDFRCEKLV